MTGRLLIYAEGKVFVQSSSQKNVSVGTIHRPSAGLVGEILGENGYYI